MNSDLQNASVSFEVKFQKADDEPATIADLKKLEEAIKKLLKTLSTKM